MRVTVATVDDLTTEQLALWDAIQRETPALDSPYCHVGFTQAVSRVRDNVRVAILEEDGEVVGFLPFETLPGRVGRPIGGRLSDYQAVVARADSHWAAEELVRGCGLAAWDFDRVCPTQESFADHSYQTHEVAHVDLAGGIDDYLHQKRRDGSGMLRQTERKQRKLRREHGELRFIADATDRPWLEQLFEWKTAQYQRTGVTDAFAVPWTRELLADLLAGDDELRGVMSVLLIDQQPVAIHYGLRCRGVLHCWFPSYDEQFARYSPGAILFLELIRACGEMGVQRIDLGGVSHWKSRFMTSTSTIREGSVDLRPVVRRLRRAARRAHGWLRQSPLRGPARVPWRMYYRFREWMAFE